MKYNGQEVTMDFIKAVSKRVTDQWDKGVYLTNDRLVTLVMKSTEEVWQEMSLEIGIGDRVRLGDEFGRVRDLDFPEIDERDYAYVVFDNGSGGVFLKEHLLKIKED